MEQPRRIVVIGGVAGGATAASKARRCCPEAEIEIYDQDEFISYAGCGLPYFIGGYSPNWRRLLARLPEEFESRQDIRVFLRHRVNEIDPENKRVRVADLEGVSELSIPYDRLIIATGAAPFVPLLPGRDLEGVFVLRSLTHALEMKSFIDLQAPHRAVIVGGGAIGLEMCEALRRLGMEVHLVELADHVLPPLDADLAGKLGAHLEANGVAMHLGAGVEGILGSNNAVAGVATTRGELEADMVLLAIGIRPLSDLARRAGIELGARDAIRVDEAMRTSVPDILACGDCATARHLVSGAETWIPLGSTARKQGRAAAETASGGEGRFPGVLGTFVLKAFEMTAGKTGLSEAEAREAGMEARSVTLEDAVLPGYYRGGGRMTARVTVEEKTGRILGAQVVGDLPAVVEKRLDVFAVCVSAGLTAGDLSSLDLAYAPPYSHPLDIPIVAGNLAEARVLGRECTCDLEGLE
ncbi:MAG: FAD-dependent oxidoreductase [Actinobacteria bacterium]|nr:FAD-dependent oxidoreductase [Actinomycetota bacterium]